MFVMRCWERSNLCESRVQRWYIDEMENWSTKVDVMMCVKRKWRVEFKEFNDDTDIKWRIDIAELKWQSWCSELILESWSDKVDVQSWCCRVEVIKYMWRIDVTELRWQSWCDVCDILLTAISWEESIIKWSYPAAWVLRSLLQSKILTIIRGWKEFITDVCVTLWYILRY